MIYFETAIETLLNTKIYRKYFAGLPYEKSVVNRVLKQFHGRYQTSYGKTVLDPDKLSDAIEQTIKSYTSDKKTPIEISKRFIKFLQEEYSMDVYISYPPIDISNSFERLMYIAKELQMSDKTIEDLSDELWTSTRTLSKDLARLRGDDDPLQICGRPFIVNDMETHRGRFSFASTVHPLFLTYNITQVIVTLKGLKHMCNDSALEPYALISAKLIWQQLSDYAKQRIIYVSEYLLPDDKDWYLSLNEPIDNHFITERECSCTNGAGVLIDCIKNHKTCYIEYLTHNGKSIFLEDCTIIPGSYNNGESIKVLVKGETKTLDLSKVQRSAYTKEQLI